MQRPCASGVTELGLIPEVGSITNQPYCALWIGACTLLVGAEKRILSNSATVWPLVKLPFPQLNFEAGSREYFFASTHHVWLVPFWSWLYTCPAVFCDLTRM